MQYGSILILFLLYFLVTHANRVGERCCLSYGGNGFILKVATGIQRLYSLNKTMISTALYE